MERRSRFGQLILIIVLVMVFFFVFVFVVYQRFLKTQRMPEGLSPPPINQNIDPNKTGRVASESTQAGFLVKRVIDGDTIVLENGETIRYIGIDAPETSKGRECFADESKQKNTELVGGKVVRLTKDVSDKDRYGRLLRYVWAGEVFINDYLVREGYAKSSTYPPDVKYQTILGASEKTARIEKKGLWGEMCNIQTVSEVKAVTIDTGLWECGINAYDCSSFATREEAQKVFEYCYGPEKDPHRLDSNKDGIVCEFLP